LAVRHPFTTARAVGSLDLLAGGRVLLGIGIGWLAEEFAAAGEDFASRAARTREIVAIMRSLWVDDMTEHHGAHYHFGPVGMAPRPVQRPVPILFGGQSAAALRRAAELGDGWMGSAQAPDKLDRYVAEMVPTLERELASHRRRREDFAITVGVAGIPSADQVARCVEAGVDRLIVVPWAAEPEPPSMDRVRQTLNGVAETVLGSLN
jgi:alkanesulfonate monooxygenase SsuD/methylene tetrahydromethanopterin reductase-like flavin-dependent oxidoreductase (luciferase family)